MFAARRRRVDLRRRRGARRAWRHGAPLLALLGLLGFETALGSAVALAAGTDPTLVLSSAQASTSQAGITAVQLTGTFNFDDVLQFAFPAGVVVYQGTRFARFGYAGERTTGTAAFLADGLSADEIDSLLALGTAATPPAALLQLQPARLAVALPEGFVPGGASVVVYAILEGTSFLSNTLSFAVPAP
jgi:hypothetical protein